MEKWGTWKFDTRLRGKLEELAMISGNCPEHSECSFLFSSAHLYASSPHEGDMQVPCETDNTVRMTQLSQHATQAQLTTDKVDDQQNDLFERGSVISAEWLSSLNDRQAESLFSQLSDEDAEHVISAVCKTGHPMLATFLCTKFLLPYIHRNPNIDDTTVGDLQHFAASFSSIVCTNLFVPLMSGQEFDTVSLQAIMKSFSPQLMSTFLGCFLDRMVGGGSLSEWQLPVLCLFSSLFTHPTFMQPLVRLLAASWRTLASSTVFGQLVMELASALEAGTPPAVVAQIVETVESLETVYKNLAMSAIKDTFSMSQE